MVYKVEHVFKNFGENKVLNDINFEVKENEKIVIIGPSGGGKSTLLRCLNLLEEVSSGTIYYHGKKMNHKNYKKIQGNIGMVFQNFQLFENMTVLDNITLAPVLNKKMTKVEAEEKAMEYLRQIHLEEKADVYPSSLSGGQKQRVAIIRTLLMNPEVILFDEPTSALDPEMIEEVLSLIMEVAKKNITMIVVTHEINFAKNFATRVLFMEEGSIIEDGPSETLFQNPKTERLQQFLNIVKEK